MILVEEGFYHTGIRVDPLIVVVLYYSTLLVKTRLKPRLHEHLDGRAVSTRSSHPLLAD